MKIFSVFSATICLLFLAGSADAGQLLLWNKLGSASEVQQSEIGPNGEIVGSVLFEQGQHGNGFRSAERTGDHNVPNNFVRFPLPGLGPQGCIEFWYHPDWSNYEVGHVIDLLQYGSPEVSGEFPAKVVQTFSYNDWSNAIVGWVRDDDPSTATARNLLYPSSTPQWSTARPVHIAFSWDVTAEKKVFYYVDGQPADSGYVELNGTPLQFLWTFDRTPYLYVGSRMYSGDWDRHAWEPNVDGVIDNIKVWNYAKTDFSDRFAEGPEGLLLWNKLGSASEVQQSEIGPDGEIVGSVLFEKGQYGNGFRSAERTGDHNVPNNFVRFPLPGLGPQGCIEFWYHPDWSNSEVGHVIDLLQYGSPEVPGEFPAKVVQTFSYNDWSDLIVGWVRDDDPSTATARNLLYPSSTPQWSTARPVHIAFSWDVTAEKKVFYYVDGRPADSGYEELNGTPLQFLWTFDRTPYLYVGSRMYSGDWDHHAWEPNVDGVIDEIKVWNYAKEDFSDRFNNTSLQMVYKLLL